MTTETGQILAWHFLTEDGYTRRGDDYPPPVKVEVGQTLTESRPLEMCRVGLHASEQAIDALQYAPGPVVCRVLLSGEVLTGKDKICASQRTVIAMVDASDVLHEFACWCAEAALTAERERGREPDPRYWAAIEAKRAWIRGEITDQDLAAASATAWDAASAARAAAWHAAWDAARAAASAARDAAWYAAWDTAWAAARDAARDAARAAAWAAARDAAWDAAWAAARDAARDGQNSELEARLRALLEIGE